LEDERARERVGEMRVHAIESTHPSCSFEREGDWRGVLQPGAPRHHRRAVSPRERLGRVARARERSKHDLGRVAQLEHHRRIDDVLTRRSPVHVPSGILVDAPYVLSEALHERNREVARRQGIP
jgi:hypothetical protein